MDQKDEQDMPLQSSFRVPTQPRISLQSYLQVVITQLKEIVPETLPVKVLGTFNHQLLDKLLHYYEQILAVHKNLTQNIALQLYFDIKFLQNSFNISREQKDQFSTLQNAYKEFIDPIDFELFSSHLIANVKKSAIRSSCLLGVLTPLGMQVPQTGTQLQDKDPNVLSLCSSGSTSLWFPLLPVVTASTATVTPESRKVTPTESPKVIYFSFDSFIFLF